MDKITIKQKEGEPEVAAECIAQSIIELAEGMKKFDLSRLRRDALITLLHHTTKVARKDITFILNAMSNLEQLYLKPKK